MKQSSHVFAEVLKLGAVGLEPDHRQTGGIPMQNHCASCINGALEFSSERFSVNHYSRKAYHSTRNPQQT